MRVTRMMGIAAVACAAGLLCMPALAQGPGGGPGGLGGLINPEQMAKAWESQSASVAKGLALNEDLTKKLSDAYKVARESMMKAGMATVTSGAPGAGGGQRGEAYRKVLTEERGKFETALKGFLDADQTTKVMSSLGSFDFRWDLMVNSLGGLGLDDKVKTDAMAAVSAYVVEAAKAREAAGGDREAMREKGAELRTKLEGDLGKILSAEQLAKLKEMPGFRRGGPGGGGGRPGRGDGDASSAPTPATPPAAATPPAPVEKKKEK